MTPETTLRYDAPADVWTDALPLGNGRIGAMVFGGVAAERLQLNDDTCWSGAPRSGSAPDGPAALAAARSALERDDVREAERQVQRLQGGFVQSYQPLVDLWIDHPASPPLDGYSRWLHLDEAVAGQSWAAGTQEAFVSRPASALVVHRTWSDGPADLDVRITSEHPVDEPRAAGTGWSATLRLPSDAPPDYVPGTRVRRDRAAGASVTAAVALEVATDGAVVPGGDGLRVRGATWATLVVATATDYVDATTPLHGDAPALRVRAASTARAAAAQGFATLREEHVTDHSELFDRVLLDLGTTPAIDLPTDQRLAADHPDPGLAALAFHYGRYLMIAGSRPGTLPLTLQGIWNDAVRPPWSSNYTLNINTEMNYWPALTAHLAECDEPLLRWIDELARAGTRTATGLYGLRGWTAHHNSDAWAFTEPVGDGTSDPTWSFWPFGGAWLARHLVEHHDVTGEPVRQDALHGAARFVLDWLVELPDGSLGTRPSTSPENAFVAADGRPAAVTTSTTADLAMARGLLTDVVRLGGPPDLVAEASAALARLPRERVSADGRLAEWRDDLPDAEPEHRHQSHLFGVYPGASIDPDQAPDLARAALATLEARGPESTGWSLAWRLNLRARLRDAAGAEAMIDAFLRPVGPPERATGQHGGVYPNLFCAHPPFQIDGNLGFTAGVVELLLQSHRTVDGLREVHLLPTLPASWPSGSVRGLRARGGVTVDLTWDRHVLVAARLVADRDTTVLVRHGGTTTPVDLRAGEPRPVTP